MCKLTLSQSVFANLVVSKISKCAFGVTSDHNEHMPVPASLSLSPSTKCIRDSEASISSMKSIFLPAYEFPDANDQSF